MNRRRWSFTASIGIVFALNGCSSSSSEEKPACRVSAPTECPSPAVTYADVSPIFDARCAGCHTGKGDDPWSLQTYEYVADWKDQVRSDLLDCSMPPPDSDIHISSEERERILAWVRCGALP